MKLTYITGGIRSGKSEYAERLAGSKNGSVLYIAFGVITDSEMKQRIDLHQSRRPPNWGLLEMQTELPNIKTHGKNYDVILIDCLSTWLSNRCLQIPETDWKKTEQRSQLISEVARWLELLSKEEKQVIIVSSEVGLGGVAMSPLGRLFQDTLGKINQLVAHTSDEAYAVLSGIPLTLKNGENR